MVRPSRLSTPVILLLAALLLAVVCGCSESSQNTERQVPDPQPSAEPQTAAEPARDIETIEEVAETLIFRDTRELLYGRGSVRVHATPEDESLAETGIRLIESMSTRMNRDELLDLLGHDNPKIRALAIAALFAQGDPSVLPRIAELMDDGARTFPLCDMMYSRMHFPDPRDAVGSVAKAVVMAYLGSVPSQVGPSDLKGPFDTYWAAHKDLPYCASWFSVRLGWASGGQGPPSEERIGFIRQVRHQIDAIPIEDRAWTLLWLHGRHAGGDQLVSEAELVELCQQLGPDKLLQMLRGEIPSDDPTFELWRSGVWWPYGRMPLFVLQHAEQLLRASDAQSLLACEQWHESNPPGRRGSRHLTPWWAIAAAHLQPQDAVDILRQAINRFQPPNDQWIRLDFAKALWELAGEEELPFIVEWFFDEPVRPPFTAFHANFVKRISSEGTPLARRTVAAIVRDRRFDELNWPTLEAIAEAVNQWTDAPVIEETTILDRHHVLQGTYNLEGAIASNRFPEETDMVLRTLEDWRGRLRKSLPQWAPPDDE